MFDRIYSHESIVLDVEIMLSLIIMWIIWTVTYCLNNKISIGSFIDISIRPMFVWALNNYMNYVDVCVVGCFGIHLLFQIYNVS